jgi:hypothetical protein
MGQPHFNLSYNGTVYSYLRCNFGFWLLAEAVFGEHGGRGYSGTGPSRTGIAGWAFDAITDKGSGNELE